MSDWPFSNSIRVECKNFEIFTVFCTSFSFQYEKRAYTTTVEPLFSRSVAQPQGRRAKKAMVYTLLLEKEGKRVYTIGPERRVYTIEPKTRKKKKRVVSTVVVYTFFFLAIRRLRKNQGVQTMKLLDSEELKKAVAVSEEKIQQRSRRRGQFSSSRFPCRKMAKPWQR